MTGMDLDVDGILKAMSNPESAKNISGIMDAVKEINAVLKEFQHTIDFLDKAGVKPLLVRAAGVKLGVDVDSPLQAEKGLKPKSQTHAQIYNQLNQMSEAEIAKMFATPEGNDGADT